MTLPNQLNRLISFDFECVQVYSDNALQFALIPHIVRDLEVLHLFLRSTEKENRK